MLPIIDPKPGEMPCVCSTLLFVKDESRKLDINTPSATLDQSLFITAPVVIVSSKSVGIVVRLGGSHCLVSFVGSIGSLMKGSNFETMYGKNIVTHYVWKSCTACITRTFLC